VPDAPQRAQEAVTYARNATSSARLSSTSATSCAMRFAVVWETSPSVRCATTSSTATLSANSRTVPAQKHDTGPRITTPETIAAERATVQHMQRGQDTVPPIMSEQRAASHVAAIECLNPAQRRVIEEILTSRDQIHGLQGLAGAGKTTALATIREAAQRNGYAVAGFARPHAPLTSCARPLASPPTPCKPIWRWEPASRPRPTVTTRLTAAFS